MLAQALRELSSEIAPPDSEAFEAWLRTLAWDEEARAYEELERWLETVPPEDRAVARADGPERPAPLGARSSADRATLDALAPHLPRLTANALLEADLPRLLVVLVRDGGPASHAAVSTAIEQLAASGRPLPMALVDELPETDAARAVRAALARRSESPSDVSSWSLARWRSVLPAPWATTVVISDLPRAHPKHRHAAKLASELKLRLTSDETTSGWSVSLRGALDDRTVAGFTPSYWGGYFAPTATDGPGAIVRAWLDETPPVRPLRPKRRELELTLETFPKLVADVSAVIGRPLLVDEADVRVFVGEAQREDLVPAVRSWLSQRL